MPDATAVVPGSSTDDAKYASNPKDFDADRTVGNNDQRHRFVFSGIYDTNGWRREDRVGPRSPAAGRSARSSRRRPGQPYSARVGNVDLNNDGNTRNDFAPGTVRNQYRLPSYYSLDLRVAREHSRSRGDCRCSRSSRSSTCPTPTTSSSSIRRCTASTDDQRPDAERQLRRSRPTTAGQRIIQLAVKVVF